MQIKEKKFLQFNPTNNIKFVRTHKSPRNRMHIMRKTINASAFVELSNSWGE